MGIIARHFNFVIDDRGEGYHFRYTLRSKIPGADIISPYDREDCPYWTWLLEHAGVPGVGFSANYDVILFNEFATAVAFKMRWNGIEPE